MRRCNMTDRAICALASSCSSATGEADGTGNPLSAFRYAEFEATVCFRAVW